MCPFYLGTFGPAATIFVIHRGGLYHDHSRFEEASFRETSTDVKLRRGGSK